MSALQMPGTKACGLGLYLTGLTSLPCSGDCGPLGWPVRRAVEGGGAAVLFVGLSGLPELDDRLVCGGNRGAGCGRDVGCAEQCELCTADRVAEGVAGADPVRVYVRAGGDCGRAGDWVHGETRGGLLGAAGRGRD